MKINKIIACQCFKKDIKKLQKKCRNIPLEREVVSFLTSLLEKGDYKYSTPKLYESKFGVLFKSRFKSCSGKGKRGGLRIIWGLVKGEKLILVKIYSKSEIENIPTEILVEELIDCLTNLDFEEVDPL